MLREMEYSGPGFAPQRGESDILPEQTKKYTPKGSYKVSFLGSVEMCILVGPIERQESPAAFKLKVSLRATRIPVPALTREIKKDLNLITVLPSRASPGLERKVKITLCLSGCSAYASAPCFPAVKDTQSLADQSAFAFSLNLFFRSSRFVRTYNA